MPGQAAALRRLDNVIWGLVTGVAAITLAASAIGGFQIVIGSYTAAVVAGVLLLATAYHAQSSHRPQAGFGTRVHCAGTDFRRRRRTPFLCCRQFRPAIAGCHLRLHGPRARFQVE